MYYDYSFMSSSNTQNQQYSKQLRISNIVDYCNINNIVFFLFFALFLNLCNQNDYFECLSICAFSKIIWKFYLIIILNL